MQLYTFAYLRVTILLDRAFEGRLCHDSRPGNLFYSRAKVFFFMRKAAGYAGKNKEYNVLGRRDNRANGGGPGLRYGRAGGHAGGRSRGMQHRRLIAALSSAGNGVNLTLAAKCTYRLTAGLPDISNDLTIAGNGPQVKGATFAGNTTAGSGGAIYDFAGAGGAIVTNSTFYGNTAAGAGGAILEDAQFDGIFSHDVIYDNRAGGDGGGIADGNFAAIENCEIFGNHASADGGGLFIGGVNPATVTGNSIWGNSAQDGGGIYNEEIENSFIQPLTNDEITGNYASADSGGICNQGPAFPEGSLNLTHTRISSNHAGSLGAASTARGLRPSRIARSALTPRAGEAASTRRS
jgi:Chlamydia polymorphic membrane protein (Chlamydia_PMP) repeat